MVEAEARSSGIYGLFCLDGAPVAAGDARALGLGSPQANPSWLIEGHDPHAPSAIHHHSDESGVTLLVGEVTDIAGLAARLGLLQTASTARIAQAALERFGPDTPAELLGEWSLLHRSRAGRLTLMVGAAHRDRFHYAIVGSRVAVAPDLFRLARIDWIGTEVDEAGMLFRWGRADVRRDLGDRTMLAAVRQLEPGTSITIEADGRLSRSVATVLTPQPPWQGTFADAVSESEALLRLIMRERLARADRPALLLSGGLDSSLLAWLMAEERRAGQTAITLTSAAPEGSGLRDETGFAKQVADHLGFDCIPVIAEHAYDFFRPKDAILSGGSGPILPNRHCLTEALQMAGKAGGATLLVNGCYGEMTVTARLPVTGLALRLRAIAAQIYHGLRGTNSAVSGGNRFHVHLSPYRLARLPEPIRVAMARPPERERLVPKRNGLLGYFPGVTKSLAQPNEFYPGALRMNFPFRDMRLYRLFAGFPVSMLLEGGSDRPVVRAMLARRLPDEIRLRRLGMPAEPDRAMRMQRQALAAHQRIPLFRKADIGEWLDLDWLDAALLQAAHAPMNNNDSNEVQVTAIAAEFLYWWRERARNLRPE